jgi:hypothetical protein
MCATVLEPILFEMPEKATTSGDIGNVPVSDAEYSETQGQKTPSTNNLIQDNTKYMRMFEPPEISGSFKTKLSISPEIGDLLADDQEFKYTLYNILNLIDKSLNGIKHDYHVGVVLDTDQDLPNWKRANIIVGIWGMDYQSILNLWDNIGSEVGSYLKSLGRNPIFPREKALSFYNFINISFTPEGRICL